MIRVFDFIFSVLGILILSPLFLVIYILIIIESKGGGFYVQKRVGRNGVDFNLLKFRSMHKDSDRKGLITIGRRDSRLTKVGIFIRRFKLDELPQLINVFKGEMSLVGPRPEVRKYVELYTPHQKRILTVRPGVTDYASIEYVDENTILGCAANPEKVYIEEIMPDKIRLNMKYIENQNLKSYFQIIFATFRQILAKKLD